MGSHPGEVWVIDQEFIACFLITLEVGTCFIHPFPLDPSLSQRVCTEMLAMIVFWRQWAVQILALCFLWTIYFCIFSQLQPIVVRGACEVVVLFWVFFYFFYLWSCSFVVILLTTLLLPAVTDTFTQTCNGWVLVIWKSNLLTGMLIWI